MHDGPTLIDEGNVGKFKPADFANVGDRRLMRVILGLTMYLELRSDDIEAILAVLATATAYADETDKPLWLLIVGPSSSGKTESLDLLGQLGVERMSDVTMPGLLGVRKERGSPVAVATGVLSRYMHQHGLVTIPDFSTMLGVAGSKNEKQAAVFSALRDIYDGEYSREHHDTGGGVLMPDGSVSPKVEWRGRMTFIAAVTNAIDNFSSFNELGPRFLYFRYTPRSLGERSAVGHKVTERLDSEQHREKARAIVTELVREARVQLHADKPLSAESLNLCVDTGNLLTIGRGNVPREAYGKREICGIPDIEEPARAVGQMLLLLRGLRALRVRKEYCYRVLRRCALSSMPIPRANVLQVLAHHDFNSTNAIGKATGMNHYVTQRALEDWEALGVMECRTRPPVTDVNTPLVGVTDPQIWTIREEYLPLVRQVVA